ncbi:Fis family transcriptional regulator [Terrabacter sp. MAHUQ-38]|uniref:Fis family transcriptional regulator n=1 Tax=unclassified Terrabacter TaxID=2630222 RepID=UPI00165DDEB0|nr:Fis family transcriptional regulator [Terrabacter sp. MAHUQ-38]MBC9820521.1 Fis family transcriptional regulator [Terrabacter sp. MAHUQ-38]
MTNSDSSTNATDTTPASGAHFDTDAFAVVVKHLTISDKDAVREAQRWTTGERGPIVDDPAVLGQVDLTAYVSEAIRIGSLALSATGQAQEIKALERMVKEVGARTAESTEKAVAETGRAVKDVTETFSRVAADTKKAFTEADALTRKALTEAVATTKLDLVSEVRRLFGGESPELLEKLAPLLDKFGVGLDEKVRVSTEALLAKAAKQFDPSDPTSPIAKHTAVLDARHAAHAAEMARQYAEITKKIEDLITAARVEDAKSKLASVTPIKGASYEDQVHAVMYDVAAGLMDEYTETGSLVGRLARCKKGDGVLAVPGQPAKVVLEMTDSPRTGWVDYLDEAERNRDAVASLGLVRTIEQNGGQSILVLGPRRIVMAFDPRRDDPSLLRTVVMLLRAGAIAVNARTGATEIAKAEEKIAAAVEQLGRIDEIQKCSGLIIKNAEKINSHSEGISTTIRRLLDQALTALGSADHEIDADDAEVPFAAAG